MTRTELNEAMAQGEIADLEVDGVDRMDYPDFCDAYFSAAWSYRAGELRPLTDTELEWLTEDWASKVNELAIQHCVGAAEYLSER